MHTKTHFQRELWQPRFLNRDSPRVWAEKGGKTYQEVVTEKALDILETHQPMPLPPLTPQGWGEWGAEGQRNRRRSRKEAGGYTVRGLARPSRNKRRANCQFALQFAPATQKLTGNTIVSE